ncbi:MAG: Hsp20/alpha crystallin family protein [Methylococcaceae bacterium]|nr:Hsp20/alpha crystallin family protein [Methylococcaceae bacterium]
MKDKVIIAITAILVIALAIQTYMVFQLNDKVNQLNQQDDLTVRQLIKKPSAIPKPKPNVNDPFLDNKSWDPYGEMQRMQAEMEQLFGDSFSRFHSNQPLGSFDKTPEVDLKDETDAYIVTVNAPGADKSSLDVKLKDQQLHIAIKTERAEEIDKDNGQYQHRERFVGKFYRVLTLPGPGNAAKMTTDYSNGVLTIRIPKQ